VSRRRPPFAGARVARPARAWRARLGLAFALPVMGLTLLACEGETPFEVIEQITFDASLGIDLADFTRLPSGVYIQDVTVGTGDPVVVGSAVTINYTGWLRSGQQFDSGGDSFIFPPPYIAGFRLGMQGMIEGGVRRIIIPPELGYGDNPPGHPIYPGAVLIFRVAVTVVN
jgi:FKBP-type peptidyl-prolyl cis-trans isomerase FkpA